MFSELMNDALVVNPEKVQADDVELGLWHPGLRYNKNLEEEGMLTTIMEWFPAQLMKTIRSRMIGESKIGTIAGWIGSFKNVLQEFSTVEAKYHDILSSISQNSHKSSHPTKPVYLHNIEDTEEAHLKEDGETVLSPLTSTTDGEDDSTQQLNAISTGRPILKKDDARRLMATADQKKSNKDLVCFRFLQHTCNNNACEYSHNTEDILKYLDETRKAFAPT